MRLVSFKIPIATLILVVSIGTASPAFAMQREGPPRDQPIVRIIKQLLHKFGITTLEEAGVPHP